MKTIIASTAQMTCQDGKTAENLEHASELVEIAVRQNVIQIQQKEKTNGRIISVEF